MKQKKFDFFLQNNKKLKKQNIKKTYYFSVTSTWSENVSDCKSTTKISNSNLMRATVASNTVVICVLWKMCFDDESANKNENFARSFQLMTFATNVSFLFWFHHEVDKINLRMYYYSIEAQLSLKLLKLFMNSMFLA